VSSLGVILTVAFPVFALVALGYAGGRLRLMGSDATLALNAFVAAFALPALLFSLLAQARIDEILNLDYALVTAGAMFGTLAIDMLLVRLVTRQRLAESSLHGLAASFGNVGYMGVPLCIAAFGQVGVLPATLAVVIGAAGLMSLTVVLIEIDLQSGHGLGRTLWRVARAVLRNPLLIAVALGLAASSVHAPIPEALQRFLDLLGAAASPCALFAIGLFLSDKSLTANLREVAIAVAAKLLLQPALAFVLAWWLLGLDSMWGKAAIILAALPGASNAFILARQYGRFVERASAIVFLSTLLSVPTVSVLLVVLGIGQP
jgi:malonate transporter